MIAPPFPSAAILGPLCVFAAVQTGIPSIDH
jgi:hypothetical protein